MFVADAWQSYALLDCSDGERLERWGDYVLIRPDPQIIWRTQKTDPRWQTAHAAYTRSSEGGGAWSDHKLPPKWTIKHRALTFNVGPTNFKHMGLFPEQAANWEFIAEKTEGRPLNVLNLFAYTGGATLAALSAGANVTHIDAAKGMIAWARENAALSGLSDRPARWIADDCAEFVKREMRRKKTYDAIILDPPSYGRGPNGKIWKLEDDLHNLLISCRAVLSQTPAFVLLNTYTTGLSAGVIRQLLEIVFGGRAEADELALPIESGGFLPCGAAGRWQP